MRICHYIEAQVRVSRSSGVNEGGDEARRAEQLMIRPGMNEGGDEARRVEQLMIEPRRNEGGGEARRAQQLVIRSGMNEGGTRPAGPRCEPSILTKGRALLGHRSLVILNQYHANEYMQALPYSGLENFLLCPDNAMPRQ